MKKNLIIFILAIVIIGGVSFYLRHSVLILNPSDQNATSTTATSTTIVENEIISTSTSTTMIVKIALLGMQTETSNKNNFRGCDVFVLQEREVPASTMPLNAAIRELFSKKDKWMPSKLAPGNFIASQDELFFDKVTIENGVANIYMLGKVKLAGVCDNPRLKIQLGETAMQFPTVKGVRYYLNSTETSLIFSEKGI